MYAPYHEAGFPVLDGHSAHTLFQVFECRTLDSDCMTSQFLELECFGLHSVVKIDNGMLQVDKHVSDDDAKAVDVPGTGWLK